jgi:spermidine synthase
MDEEQAIGSEVLVARDPDYPSLRNDAAMTYMAIGRPVDALRHFEAVTRLTPASAVAWYNEGVALAAAGRRQDAAERYRRAIALDPSYSQAHNNLGNLLAADNQIAAAMASYQEAIRHDASNAEAHCSLAQAMVMSRQPRAASLEFGRALELAPGWTACATSYVWLLSAHHDPLIRDPEKGISLGEAAVRATRSLDPSALDALAAAYAAAGRFDDAVRVGTLALREAEKRPAAATEQVRERVDLYRRHQPFVVPD